MDPVNPWLDPSEVRLLAEQLLRPISPAGLPTADPGFNQSFIGFTDNQPQPQSQQLAPQVTQDIPSQTTPVNIPPQPLPIPTAQTAPTPPPQPNPQARFLQRIQMFRDWLAEHFNASDIFILDRSGKIMFDESGHGRLHFMARNLALSTRVSGSIHVKIGPSAVLEIIPCDTPYGRVILGALVPESLSSGHIQMITDVLLQTASPS